MVSFGISRILCKFFHGFPLVMSLRVSIRLFVSLLLPLPLPLTLCLLLSLMLLPPFSLFSSSPTRSHLPPSLPSRFLPIPRSESLAVCSASSSSPSFSSGCTPSVKRSTYLTAQTSQTGKCNAVCACVRSFMRVCACLCVRIT